MEQLLFSAMVETEVASDLKVSEENIQDEELAVFFIEINGK
jgi:hypothetical protein